MNILAKEDVGPRHDRGRTTRWRFGLGVARKEPSWLSQSLASGGSRFVKASRPRLQKSSILHLRCDVCHGVIFMM